MILLMAAALQIATPVPPVPPARPGAQQRQVVVIRHVGPDGKVTEQRLEGEQAARAAEMQRNCDPARTFSSDVDRTVDGKRQISRIRVCATHAETAAQWRQALHGTIDRVRSDQNLPADVRARVVAELEAALAKAH